MKQLYLTFQSSMVEANLEVTGISIGNRKIDTSRYTGDLYDKIGRLGHFAFPVKSKEELGIALHMSQVDNFDYLYLVEVEEEDVIPINYKNWINYVRQVMGTNNKVKLPNNIFNVENSEYNEYIVPAFTKEQIVKTIKLKEHESLWDYIHGTSLDSMVNDYVQDVNIIVRDTQDLTNRQLDSYATRIVEKLHTKNKSTNKSIKEDLEFIKTLFIK